MQNGSLFDRGFDMITLFAEQDANSDITGDWLKMVNYQRATVFVCKFGTEDVDDLGLQLLQATSNAGAGSKALTASRYWYKTGTLTSQATWTAGVHSTAADGLAFGASVPSGFTRTVADVNTDPLILATDFHASDLDADNGYKFFTVFVEGDNVNNAVLLTSFVILMDCRFPGAVPPSSLS